MTTDENRELISRAKGGDRAAFTQLVEQSAMRLRAVIKRIVGHPDDTEELYQDSLLKAWNGLASFRGDAAFTTWLCAIGARTALDFLRANKPWRDRAQIAYGNECSKDPRLGAEVRETLANPAFTFDVHEHINYCFGCVGRSLPAEQQAVLVLREVMSLSAREASEALGLTESVVKHQLSAARKQMNTVFESLCSLVNKTGVCYQCKGLRMASANGANDDLEKIGSLDQRIDIIRSVGLAPSVSQKMHDIFWRRTAELEAVGRGSCDVEVDCGRGCS